jgi:hypothetical protein
VHNELLNILLEVADWPKLSERRRAMLIELAKAERAVDNAEYRLDKAKVRIYKAMIAWREPDPVPTTTFVMKVKNMEPKEVA